MSDLALRPGALIAGRYRLERMLGEGGMAIVWEATHTVTNRTVAMKFLRESLRTKEQLRERFHREASAASSLHHPNVVEIVDVFDFEEGAPVMVMELLHGETLGRKLERDEKLSLEETAALIVPVISAVGAAHALGIVHRDLKPDNVFLATSPAGPVVKVLDFGIAKIADTAHLKAMRTEAGSMLGTPCYMAPEQAAANGVVDHRADIWSLGVILYECLSGTRPIEGDDLVQVVTRLVSEAIMPLERLAPELPREVSALVMQMLSRDAARRPVDLTEVSKLFASYTRTRAPAFGPASTGKAWAATPDEIQKARVVMQTRTADPRGPTLLSTPPVPSSVTVVAEGPGTPATQRSKVGMVVVAAIVAIVAIVIVLVRSDGGARAPNGGQTLDEPPAGATATTAPVATNPATATATAPVASAPASASAPKVAHRPRASPPAGARATPPQKPSPPETTAEKPQKPQKDENTLFSGRK